MLILFNFLSVNIMEYHLTNHISRDLPDITDGIDNFFKIAIMLVRFVFFVTGYLLLIITGSSGTCTTTTSSSLTVFEWRK